MKFNNSIIQFSTLDLNKNIVLPKLLDENLAEEIGLHVGDGSMNYYKIKNKFKGFYQLRGHIVDDKGHYNKRIRFLYKKLYNLDISIRKMPSTGVIGFQVWSDVLVAFKHKILGLSLGKKTDIFIPKEILNNENLSRSFLRGFFDTDGCIYTYPRYGKLYPRVEINSVSKLLMFQVKQILGKLNFRFSLHVSDREKYGWNDLYRIHIRGVNMTKKWFETIRPANPKHWTKFLKLMNDGPSQI